jgi:uncharacterized protein YjbI with pentapeptide repeats
VHGSDNPRMIHGSVGGSGNAFRDSAPVFGLVFICEAASAARSPPRAFFPAAFFAEAFFAGAFFAGAFFGAAFFAGAFLAGAFLAGAFLAGAFLAGAFFAGAFFAGAFFAGGGLCRLTMSLTSQHPR